MELVSSLDRDQIILERSVPVVTANRRSRSWSPTNLVQKVRKAFNNAKKSLRMSASSTVVPLKETLATPRSYSRSVSPSMLVSSNGGTCESSHSPVLIKKSVATNEGSYKVFNSFCQFRDENYTGFAILKLTNASYVGAFVKGKKHGAGRYTFENRGEVYRGNFTYGKRDGEFEILDKKTRKVIRKEKWENGLLKQTFKVN